MPSRRPSSPTWERGAITTKTTAGCWSRATLVGWLAWPTVSPGRKAGRPRAGWAIEVTLRAWRELPADLPQSKRLMRAVQQANIEVHELSLVVPELRGMA